jgi:hypothetical protein
LTVTDKSQNFMQLSHGIFYVVATVCVVVLTVIGVRTSRQVNPVLSQTADTTKELKGTAGALTGTLNQVQSTLVTAQPVMTGLAASTKQVDVTLARLNGAILQLQRPCVVKNIKGTPFFTDTYTEDAVMPCGLFADTADVMKTVRGAFGQVEVAARHENQNLTTLDKQEAQLFTDLHTLLVDGHTLLVSANTLLTDKDVVEFIQHSNNIAAHVDGVSGDIQSKTHEILYPAPCKGKMCWIKRTYTVVNGVVQLGRPAFYWGELINTLQ